MYAVPDTPFKRRKTETYDVIESLGYDSQQDSGDELFEAYETVATLPVSKQQHATMSSSSPAPYITQPTQMIGKAMVIPGTPPQRSSTVQVVASSPPGMSLTPTLPGQRSGGILANAMAPPGTAFRLPMGVARQPFKQMEVIDLSDDEGMKYQGGSSDEDSQRDRRNIKPSIFIQKPRQTSSFGDKTKSMVETGAVETGPVHFGEIMAKSVYKSTEKTRPGSTFSGTVFDSRNRDERITTSTIPTIKRSADVMANAYGGLSRTLKQNRQNAPSKAVAVVDMSLDDVPDYGSRLKIERIQGVLPKVSIRACYQALVDNKGHVDDAMNALVLNEEKELQIDLTVSDDEDPLASNLPQKTYKQPAKQQLKVPNRKIQEKYTAPISARNPQPLVVSPLLPVKQPKRRRLMQGRKRQSSPILSSPKIPLRVSTPVSVDESDSDQEVEQEDDSQLDQSLLDFFNTCSTADLTDIAAIPEEIASFVLTHKPFENLDEIRRISHNVEVRKSVTKRVPMKRPIGDKIVGTCETMVAGYLAIDQLLKRCEAIGKPVADEMQKWGVDVFGASKKGELEIVTLADIQDEDKIRLSPFRDSGIGTPISGAGSADEEMDGDVIKSSTMRVNTNQAFFPQPSIMAEGVTLKDYQVVGINWLSLLFEKELSCILADDMGLGKTCQVVAFLAHLLEKGIQGPHLIVVPGSTLENWLREFGTFCPKLVVMPYYAGMNERADLRDDIESMEVKPNVIITTYTLASKKDDTKFLRRLKPCVCVFDEGHMLKNSTSAVYKQLMTIPAKFRLLLTGTPLQNNLIELASLLGFILPSVFDEHKHDLKSIFKHKAKTTDEGRSALLSEQRIARAKAMMTPFVLRRKKHQVLKHLPTKTRRVEYCELSPQQHAIYESQKAKQLQIVQDREAGKKSSAQNLNNLMELRKASIHPLLFRRLYDETTLSEMSRACLGEPENRDSDPDLVFEDFSLFSDWELHTYCVNHPKTMTPFLLHNGEWMQSGKVDALVALLQTFKAAGDRILIFSQFVMVLNILEAVLETLGMSFFRIDGSTDINARQPMIDQFYDEPDILVFMLSTKAGGAGINLACANKVIIFDSGFNPQEDIQAENRAHRVGQTQEVEVIRLVTRGTIEEQIHALGETKLALDDRVAGEGEGVTVEKAENLGASLVEELFEKELLGTLVAKEGKK